MPKRKRNFRWVKWLIILALIVGAIVVVVLVKNNFNKKIDNNDGQTSNVDKSEEKKTENKTENQDSGDTEKTQEQEQKAPQYEGESPNKSETLTGLITYADVVNDELVIRVNIDQFLQSGSCNLTISRNGVTHYSQSVGIQESVTTSTCDGYKIPVSELSKGDFVVEINLDSDNKSGKITGKVRI